MYLWNFAVDGATYTLSYVDNDKQSSLEKQFQLFNNKKPNWKGDSTLFAFWFGVNDIILTNQSKEDTIKAGLQKEYEIFLKLYDSGARNFLFINVPPFDRSPLVINSNNIDYYSDFIKSFNLEKQRMAMKLTLEYPDTNIFLYNAKDEFNYLFENHSSVNIPYIGSTAEGDNNTKNVDQYFWYNALHPSTAVHYYLATDIHQLLNNSSVHKVEPSVTHEKALDNFDKENSYFDDKIITTPSKLEDVNDNTINSNTNSTSVPSLNNVSASANVSGSIHKFQRSINSSYFALAIFLFYFIFF